MTAVSEFLLLLGVSNNVRVGSKLMIYVFTYDVSDSIDIIIVFTW